MLTKHVRWSSSCLSTATLNSDQRMETRDRMVTLCFKSCSSIFIQRQFSLLCGWWILCFPIKLFHSKWPLSFESLKYTKESCEHQPVLCSKYCSCEMQPLYITISIHLYKPYSAGRQYLMFFFPCKLALWNRIKPKLTVLYYPKQCLGYNGVVETHTTVIARFHASALFW